MQFAGATAAVGAVRARAARADRSLRDLSLNLAGYPFDRVAALTDGRVSIEGCDHSFERTNIYTLNAVAMGGDQKWEVQEIGLHPYRLAFANDDFRDYTLIPSFPCGRSVTRASSFAPIAASRSPRTCAGRRWRPRATRRAR